MPARPRWTDHDVSDPGVTLLELLAYAADRLDAYAERVADEARLRSRRRLLTVGAVIALGVLWWSRRDDDGSP
jgi:hypothetical protein